MPTALRITPPVLPPRPPPLLPPCAVKLVLSKLLIHGIVSLAHPRAKLAPAADSRCILAHPRLEVFGTVPTRVQLAESGEEGRGLRLKLPGGLYGVGSGDGVQQRPGGAAEALDVRRAVRRHRRQGRGGLFWFCAGHGKPGLDVGACPASSLHYICQLRLLCGSVDEEVEMHSTQRLGRMCCWVLTACRLGRGLRPWETSSARRAPCPASQLCLSAPVPSFVPNSSRWWLWHAVRSEGDFKACRPWSVRAGPRTCFFCRDGPCSIASSSLANPLALDCH